MPAFIVLVSYNSFLTQHVELKNLTSLLIELKWQIWDCRAALRSGFSKGGSGFTTVCRGCEKWWSPFQMVRQSGSRCSILNWQGMNWHSDSPRFLVISTRASRRREISLRSEEAPWWWEISRLRIFIEPRTISPDTDRQLRSRWQWGRAACCHLQK